MAFPTQTCNTISVRLDETNYPTWVFQMKHYLRGHGLLKWVDGSHPCPPKFIVGTDGSLIANTEAYEKWLQQDSFIISMITNALSAEALTLVIGCETSMEVWITLKKHYATNSEFHIMRLKSTLQNIRKGADSIDKYLLRFKSVRDHLVVVGIRISDQDIKSLILAGLPSEYGHTRQIIRGKSSISMEEVRSLLLSAEFQIELKHRAMSLALLTAMMAHNHIFGGNSSLPCAPQWTDSYITTPYNCSIATGMSNPNAYNAPTMPSGVTQLGVYNAFPGNAKSQIGYAIPSTTMTSGMRSFSGYQAQSGGGPSMPYIGYQQQGFSHNNNNYSVVSQKQKGNHPQTRAPKFRPQQNGFNNSNSDGGYTEDNVTYPSFPVNRGISNNNRANGNMNDSAKPRNAGSSLSNPIVCQICEKPGHSALKCYYKNGIEASSSTAVCQICKGSDHIAKSCFYRQQNQQLSGIERPIVSKMAGSAVSKSFAIDTEKSQVGAAPKALSASICTQPKPSSIVTQLNNNAFQSQVKPLPFAHASPLLVPCTSNNGYKPHKGNDVRWEAIQAVRDHDGMLGLNNFKLLNGHLMNCRQACESMNLWQSLPLIPPG